MLDLRIDLGRQDLQAVRDLLDERRIARAARRAGNDAIEGAKSTAIAYIRTKKRIKESTIERRLSVTLPSNRAGLAAMRWALRPSAKPISIGSYPSEQTPGGVVAEVNVGQTIILRHAFIRVVRNGFRGVFERAGQGAPRYPIKSLVASGVGDVLRDREAAETIGQAFNAAITTSLSRYLAQETGLGGVP